MYNIFSLYLYLFLLFETMVLEMRLLLNNVLSLSLFLAISIATLGYYIILTTESNASIALSEYDKQLSSSFLSGSVMFIYSLWIIVQLFCLALFLQGKLEKLYGVLLLSMILLVTIESLLFKFITCFNYYNNQPVIIRSSLVYVYVIVISSIAFLIARSELENKSYKLTSTVFTLATFITVTIINIIIMVKLRPSLSQPIGPQHINIGYFNESDIRAIKNGSYLKDEFYDYRILCKLNDVMSGDITEVTHDDCYESCTNLYVFHHFINIKCTEEKKFFFKDCLNASSLLIRFDYSSEYGHFPKYNCAILGKNDTCSVGCPQLYQDGLNLVLTQEKNKKVESAWNGLCNCVHDNLNINLILDSNINPCLSNASLYKISFFLLAFMVFLII
jgi:hypothetical protein